MKKLIFTLVVFGLIGMISCKKDESIQPEKSNKSLVADKKDIGTGDWVCLLNSWKGSALVTPFFIAIAIVSYSFLL